MMLDLEQTPELPAVETAADSAADSAPDPMFVGLERAMQRDKIDRLKAYYAPTPTPIVRETRTVSGMVKLHHAKCPDKPDGHDGGDPCTCVLPDSTHFFRCQHTNCKGLTFADVEKVYGPLTPDKAGKTDKLTFPVLTCAELDRTACAFDWVIEDTLLAGQPGVLAGPKKVLKTTVVLAGGISIATGEPFLGKWKVPRPRNVLIMSGESGLATIQETMRRQCKAMGVNLPDVDKLFLSDAIPRFDNRKHLDALERAIESTRCEVLIIDPCYLAMPGVDAGNVFIQGERLGAVGGVCQKHGVGLLLCHHCRKRAKTRSSADYEPPELDDISWAGFSEYARQWILLGRREEYTPGSGEHRLWLSIGGSAGQSALWGLDVDEGPSGSPRHWKVDLLSSDKARADRKGASIRQRLLDAAHEFPNGETKTGILDTARLKSDHATRAVFDALVSDGILLASTVTKNAIGYPGYRLAEGGASCPTQTK